MNAFIVRPFGEKSGIDFEWVDRELISPALARLEITGRTTAEITRQGNIRTDMFQLLVTADIVIADISIHNANVFYELGLRHAFRDKSTFLLRARIDDVPFDLKTDRYLDYDPKNPEGTLEELTKAIKDTIRESAVDSPPFQLLPDLKSQDASRFIVVPADFREEVERAFQSNRPGDLEFLHVETKELSWRREGLRLIGEAQFRLKDYAHAATTWEFVRSELLKDVQANLRLGTIYQKLADLVKSDEALRRLLPGSELTSEQLAEIHALLGSNAKTRWMADWANLPAQERPAAALRSPPLSDAFEEYRKGFEANLNHYYSGLNALALVTVITSLAGTLPEVWEERFNSPAEAEFRLTEYLTQRDQLAGAVELSIRAEQQRLKRNDRKDPWCTVSLADLSLLLARPNVAQAYRNAIRDLDPVGVDAVRRQVEIYRELNLFEKQLQAAAPVFAALHPPPSRTTITPRIILFTGHRMDEPGRKVPRLPASKESMARQAIQREIERVLPGTSPIIAISGGASGGDLLFLEVCQELGIERHMHLIMPREPYVVRSVAPAGAGWITRFHRQYETAQTRVYQDSDHLPAWLQPKPNYTVWERSNIWMLHNSLWSGPKNLTLIALWDGSEGDGPGGTRHMVELAQGQGACTLIVNPGDL